MEQSVQANVATWAPDPGETTQVSVNGITRVLIGGFDNAGKSTLACSLYRALQDDGVATSLYELDRWSDTHAPILGHKTWEQRTKVAEVSPAEYAAYAEQFKQDQASIVLGDIEGRYQNPHPRCLKDSADFGILVSRDPIAKDATSAWPQSVAGWEQLFDQINVPVAIRVHSVIGDQRAPADHLAIDGLERSLVPQHPGIKALAARVMELTVVAAGGLSW